MRIRTYFHLTSASTLIFCSVPVWALDGRGGPCGASLLQVMFNPMLIVIALAVAVCVGTAVAAWRNRRESRYRNSAPQAGIDHTGRYELASVAPKYRIFSKPAVIVGLCVYLLLLGPAWLVCNICI